MNFIAQNKHLNKKKQHSSLCFHQMNDMNRTLGESILWIFSAQALIHGLIHILSLLPILFGLSEWHHHDNHAHEVGKMVSYSFALNIILHIGMAMMVVIAEKMRNKK